MNRIISILHTKTATALCLAIAIASRIINVFFVSYAGRDKMILVMQSKSLLDGNGFVIPQYMFENPGAVVYDTTPYWPPGYPIALAPLLKLFNYDIYNATTALDIIVCIALIFVVRKICRQIGFTTAAVNIATLITGCFEYTFIHDSLPTDSVSLLFLLIGFSFLIKAIQKETAGFPLLLTTGFFLFLPNFFRYSYPAVSVGVPLLLLAIGLWQKQKSLIKKGIILTLIVTVLLASLFFFINQNTGSVAYLQATGRGVFLQNVIHWYPVVPASFINISFLSSQSAKYFGTGPYDLLGGLELINIISIIIFCGWFFFFFRKKRFLTNGAYGWFLLLGFCSSVIIFLSLGYLSLTYKMLAGYIGDWNYVFESRYYAFVFLFIQLCFIAALFRYSSIKSLLVRAAVLVAAVIITVEITHNLYFNTKVALSFDKYKSEVYREQDYKYFTSLIDDLERENPDADIFATAYKDNFYQYMTTYLGHKGFVDAITLNDRLPDIKRKTFLVLMLYTPDIPLFEKYLSGNPVKKMGQVDYSHFYLLELNP